MWPKTDFLNLLNLDVPIIQAPMAGASGAAMAAAACGAGALGSLPCAMLSVDKMRAEMSAIRQHTNGPVNMNFFCHQAFVDDPVRQAAWKRKLAPFYEEHGLDLGIEVTAPVRAPFDENACAVVEELRPAVVSFHFGLPEASLLERVRAAGAKIISSATTVKEARWLDDNGCDAIIAQGFEAGGHRGMFLDDKIATQIGTMALVPQIVDAVSVPVIAAGGIADGRGIAAAFALGASAVQIGTAYLFTPEALVTDLHRSALKEDAQDQTALTNIFSGRPARGVMNRIMHAVGPMSEAAPAFPSAGGALAPLKKAAEAEGKSDFTSLWSGQAAALGRELDAMALTRQLAEDARAILKG